MRKIDMIVEVLARVPMYVWVAVGMLVGLALIAWLFSKILEAEADAHDTEYL
jgi:hypothetical protein